MGKQAHKIPREMNNTVPRCPLCGIVLETTIHRITETTGTVSIARTALKHLGENHLIEVNPDSKPIAGEVLEETRCAEDVYCASSKHHPDCPIAGTR